MKRTLLGVTILAIFLTASFLPMSMASNGHGPKKIHVSQSEIDKIVKQLKSTKVTNGPNSVPWPSGAQINYTCGTSGCALVFNEAATKGMESMITLGVGITGVVTAILALTGVGAPMAAVVGLVVAVFVASGAWIAFADGWGGNLGIYGGWYSFTTMFYIWCNPVPSYFTSAPATTTSTSSSDPTSTSTSQYTSTVTYTTTVTYSTSSTSTSTTSICVIHCCTGNFCGVPSQ